MSPVDQVEVATLEWVDWLPHRRLYEHCDDLPPAEYEAPTTVNTELSRRLSSQTSKSPDSPGRFRPR